MSACRRNPGGRRRRAAARGRRRRDALRHRPWARARGRRRVVHARTRTHARHRGRVGLGQDRVVALDHGPAAQARRRAAWFDPLRGHRDRRCEAEGHAPLLGRPHGDGVPGPDDVAEPGDEDRPSDHRVDPHPPRRRSRRSPTSSRCHCSRRYGCPIPSAACPSTRTSSPGVCGNGSASRSRWRVGPSCCSPTSPPPRSTSPCRRRCSTCWSSSSASGSWRSSS